MGMMIPVCDFLIRLHKQKPIGPNVLFIARQTIPLTKWAFDDLLKLHGLTSQYDGPVEYDSDTVNSTRGKYISDKYFMKCLGVKSFHSLDVTDYEAADIVWDLGMPIPEEHHNKYDFIYNGGCFDNMFNPGVALMNVSKLLSSGGRMVCMESAASYNSPYLIFSPGWFHDYFVSNNYDWGQIYICSYGSSEELWHGPWKIRYVNVPAYPNGGPPKPSKSEQLIVLAVGQKGASSTDEVQPVQYQYRATEALRDTFNRSQEAFVARRPPLIVGRTPVQTKRYLNKVGSLGVGFSVSRYEHYRELFMNSFPGRVYGKLRSMI